MKKAVITFVMGLIFLASNTFAETGDCTRFIGTWQISIGDSTETWTFKPSLFQTEQMVFGENDNNSQIIVSWVELLPAYIATDTSTYDNYYVQFDNDTRFSGYHFMDNALLIVGIVPPEDDPFCPARMLLKENDEKLAVLRNYRDQVLSKTATGKRMIALYYRLAPTLCRLIENNPYLIKPCRTFLTLVLE